MRLVFIREADSETFELNSHAYGGFILDESATIPGGTTLEVTGSEYSGRDGGYPTSSRLQRRPFTAPFILREDHTHVFGLFQLVRQAAAFFDSHDEDLVPKLFTIEFYSDDRVESKFMLRHGTISVPFNSKVHRGEMSGDGQVSFIFGDPYLYPIGDSGLTFRLYAGGQAQTLNGRQWDDTDGALWDVADGKIWTNAGGSGDPVVVDVDSIATVPVSVTSSGQLVDPQIINSTNGSSFSYDGTLGPGDILTIDTAGVVLVNGAPPANPYSGVLTAQGGSNTFVLLAAGSSPGYVDLNILGAF